MTTNSDHQAEAPSFDERAMLGRVWSAFGCAWNPDDFKPTVRARMWEQVVEMAREATERSSRIYRENQQLEAALSARPVVDDATVERAARAILNQGVNLCGDDRGCECEENVDCARDLARVALRAACADAFGYLVANPDVARRKIPMIRRAIHQAPVEEKEK